MLKYTGFSKTKSLVYEVHFEKKYIQINTKTDNDHKYVYIIKKCAGTVGWKGFRKISEKFSF